jgi:hypothetical protein
MIKNRKDFKLKFKNFPHNRCLFLGKVLSIQKPQANIVVKKILLGNYLGLFLSFHF